MSGIDEPTDTQLPHLETVIIRPILKGWNAEALMSLDLQATKMEDQERLVK